MVVTVPWYLIAPRPLTLADFAGLSAPATAIGTNDNGDFTVTFDGDLTPLEQAFVRRRVQSLSTAAEAIREAAENAVANNQAFLALTTPTNAQVVAQVRDLTRQLNHVIRLVVNRD